MYDKTHLITLQWACPNCLISLKVQLLATPSSMANEALESQNLDRTYSMDGDPAKGLYFSGSHGAAQLQ